MLFFLAPSDDIDDDIEIVAEDDPYWGNDDDVTEDQDVEEPLTITVNWLIRLYKKWDQWDKSHLPVCPGGLGEHQQRFKLFTCLLIYLFPISTTVNSWVET